MRARWSVAIVVLLMLASSCGVTGLTEQERAGGWSGELPKGLPVGRAPTVEFKNVTIPIDRSVNATGSVKLKIYDERMQNLTHMELQIDILGWAMLGEERDIFDIESTKKPRFVSGDGYYLYAPSGRKCIATFNGTLGDSTQPWDLTINVSVPTEAVPGFYRVGLRLFYYKDQGSDHFAVSRSWYQDNIWNSLLEKARIGENMSSIAEGVVGLLPEAGFTVAPPRFDYISRPNRVPDFGNFTTPVIRPGERGKYNFTISNRYDANMTDVRLEVSLYMWATLEESKAIDRLGGPRPKFENGDTTTVLQLGNVTSGGRAEPALYIRTSEDTPKGTYFVRHRLTFTYMGEQYTMSSRGYFTTPQWEGFDYGNLYYQLNVSGIVPDSSISVKDPVPLWPLGLLVGLCALFGALAVVFYLAEEHGPEYPRLKKALQYWTGKLEQRRRLVQQRLDELRGEVDVPLEDDEP